MGTTTLGATAMDLATALAWALLSLAAAAALGLLILIAGLALVFARAPRLAQLPAPDAAASVAQALAGTSLTVVVPAYNEAANIAACLSSILDSEDPCGDWRVLLVDDCSGGDRPPGGKGLRIQRTPLHPDRCRAPAGR